MRRQRSASATLCLTGRRLCPGHGLVTRAAEERGYLTMQASPGAPDPFRDNQFVALTVAVVLQPFFILDSGLLRFYHVFGKCVFNPSSPSTETELRNAPLTPRVLVVEDDRTNRECLGLFLKMWGYEVRLAC